MKLLPKKVILDQIWPIFGPSLVLIVPKIPEFEKMFHISGVYHRNTSTDRVSAQNNKELTKKWFVFILWIISYKFGAYLKRFWYTFLTTWYYLRLAAMIDKHVTKFQKNWQQIFKEIDRRLPNFVIFWLFIIKNYCL